jgi:hypothetical protein
VTTRDFPLGVVLSITTGILFTDLENVYDICNWMSGDNLMTHQLPRVAEECASELLRQHPQLDLQPPSEFADFAEVLRWLSEQVARYGDSVRVAPLQPADHTTIDPLAELAMMNPHVQVLVVEVPNQGQEAAS